MPLVPIHAAADDGKLRISVFGAHPTTRKTGRAARRQSGRSSGIT